MKKGMLSRVENCLGYWRKNNLRFSRYVVCSEAKLNYCLAREGGEAGNGLITNSYPVM